MKIGDDSCLIAKNIDKSLPALAKTVLSLATSRLVLQIFGVLGRISLCLGSNARRQNLICDEDM